MSAPLRMNTVGPYHARRVLTMWGQRWGVVDEDGRTVIEHPLTGEVLLWPQHTKRGEAAARQAARELNLYARSTDKETT